MISEDQLDSFLSHHGVKGQKWGLRNQLGSRNRSLNKTSRVKDRNARDKLIDTARARVTSKDRSILVRLGLSDKGSKSYNEYHAAVHKFKKERFKVGSREARKALNKAHKKRMNDIQLSKQAKSGKETTVAILGAVGSAALSGYRPSSA